MNIDYNKVPVKYITGTYQYEETYPTACDLLYDMVSLCGQKFKYDKLAYIVKLDYDKLDELLLVLTDGGFVKKKDDNITILHTPWDGESND